MNMTVLLVWAKLEYSIPAMLVDALKIYHVCTGKTTTRKGDHKHVAEL